MVRIATVNDAVQLNELNNEFNGKGETTIEQISDSLLNNKQEIVVVDEEDDILVGFVCVQLKKSFCYDVYMPEITEVYVKQAYRRRGISRNMMTFAEDYCCKNYEFYNMELLTGKENFSAQSVYKKLGYRNDQEIHMKKVYKSISVQD
ncbi:MAG: GNAT family N-acetyltransferase [Oscillospiraceae bacterium]